MVDQAILDAQDAADFERRRRSMASRATCLAQAAELPQPQRARIEEACRRAPAP